jgi:AcrR family transcriptional regulator
MSDAQTTVTPLSRRPKRADAARNYDKLVDAARAAFTEDGTEASLEDVARRAGVGIGTLYRNFPNRQALLEAVYLEEVERMARKADELAELDPWEALAAWLRHFVGYAATKRALVEELANISGDDSEVLLSCRRAITEAGEPLLRRAQDAGVVRDDLSFIDVGRMVGGIALIRAADPGQIERILEVALDGLRYRA